METLWAPWRMKYILKEERFDGCIFCLKGGNEDLRERLILHVSETCMVIMNRYPYNNGHLMVAPLKHCPNPEYLAPAEMLEIMELLRSSMAILRKVMSPEGFNVGLNLGIVAGAGVEDHMHFHIVPRWGGDTNYMTVVGEVRVIPEHILATYDKLHPHFQALKSGGSR